MRCSALAELVNCQVTSSNSVTIPKVMCVAVAWQVCCDGMAGMHIHTMVCMLAKNLILLLLCLILLLLCFDRFCSVTQLKLSVQTSDGLGSQVKPVLEKYEIFQKFLLLP